MQFDIVIVGDFRFPGGTSAAIAHEIRALHGAGYSVGMVQKRAPILKQAHPIHPAIQACIRSGQAVLVEGRGRPPEVAARLAVLHNPYVFQETGGADPKIVAERKILVAHQPVLDQTGVPYYSVEAVQRVVDGIVGEGALWAPISPLSRRNMLEAKLPYPILEEDWTNVIFVEDWAADRSVPVADRPVIGRHSRPGWQKWPATRDELLTVYPDDEDFAVRMLGAGEALADLLGGPPPPNWTTFEFNEMPPEEFLRGIDFFVYYHHPDWVEGFGRTIAEAAASGAVVILPEHFRPTFGEAALYRQPAEIRDTVRTLYGDWESYRLQSQLGQRLIERMYGPVPYLARIERLIGDGGERRRTEVAPVAAAAPPALDILHLGDFRLGRDSAWRVAEEIAIQAERGYASGLLHVDLERQDRFAAIHPTVDGAVRAGLAVPINPNLPAVRTRLLVVQQPDAFLESVRRGSGVVLPRITADAIVVVADRSCPAEVLVQQDALLTSMFGPGILWTAVHPQVHRELAGSDGLRVDDAPWRPAVAVAAPLKPKAAARARLAIGRIGLPISGNGSGADDDVFAAYAVGSSEAVVRVLDPTGPLPETWERFSSREIDPWKFVADLDFLVQFPAGKAENLPTTAIVWALAQGIPVVLPKALEPVFARGPIYADPAEVPALLAALHADPERLAELKAETARQARQAWGPNLHRARLRRLAGEPEHGARKLAARRAPRRRILFFSSNGVGLGHLTRLLAIARRLPGEFEPVFATLSQALTVVEQAGYPVEYLPFHVYANCDPNDWNYWLAEQAGQILDFHDPAAVVFDGGMPYSGLIRAVAARRGLKFVWVRRGMWLETQNNEQAIARQRYCDLIIEPSDIAEAVDRGATSKNRSAVLKVPPISLLEADELVDRPAAAARLGLDPERPAVLVQLGSGWNRELTSMIDTILAALGRRPEIQPVLAEWLISGTPLDFWPGVPRLRGFPITKYYNAFDFTISAAGYNSFNEIISFGLPAIFVPNEHGMLDDQGGRAAYADENGAGFSLPGSRLDEIGGLVEAMLDDKVRWLIKGNCSRLAKGNGAGEAAEAIARLAG